MTSSDFQSHPIRAITIERESRQRKKLTGIDELADSISRLGLIHPIVVDREGILVAGERRLTACTQLGWDNIPVQFVDDLDEYTLQCIELEENMKRSDLTWQDEVEAVARLHALKSGNEEDWSASDTANFIGASPSYVEKRLQVANAMTSDSVAKAETFSTAHNITKRDGERKKSSALLAVTTSLDSIVSPDAPVQPKAIPLINESFLDWAPAYTGSKFNLIHCDFPYGINVADAPRMSAGMADHYEDSADIYWALVAALAAAMDNVVAESAHLIFWFSPKYYCDTKQQLERMGWKLTDYPLIWHKTDGAGVAPDPQRGPRNTYEMAFFGVRGDRKITAAGTKANSYAFPGKRTDAIHVSEKPYVMLKHFLTMLCDDYSRVLDPTCGSGNALKVAEDLGAARVLGIEQLPDFYENARASWEKRG